MSDLNLDEDKIKDLILAFSKSALTSILLKEILKVSATGGLKGRLAVFVIEELFDEFVGPVLLHCVRKGMRVVDTEQGKVLIAKLDEAVLNNDKDAYISNIGDV